MVNTGNRLVNFLQKFGKQWELESLVKTKRTVRVVPVGLIRYSTGTGTTALVTEAVPVARVRLVPVIRRTTLKSIEDT